MRAVTGLPPVREDDIARWFDRDAEAQVLIHVGDARHAANDPDQARQAWQHASDILDELGHPASDHPEIEQLRAKLRR